jgi:hypothetical protein
VFQPFDVKSGFRRRLKTLCSAGPPIPMSEPPPEDRFFPPTAWTVLLAARDPAAPDTATAREEFCRAYWRPVAAFLEALGLPEPDAHDGAQEIMAQLFSRDGLQQVEPYRGRLRAYLKSAARHWKFRLHRASHTLKRGQGTSALPLDEAGDAPASPEPDFTFDQEWALTLCDRALRSLEESYTARGRATLFTALKPAFLQPGGVQQLLPAGSLPGVTDAQLRIEIHRLRRRLADRLRMEVAATLGPWAGAAEVEEETRYLVRTLAHERRH